MAICGSGPFLVTDVGPPDLEEGQGRSRVRSVRQGQGGGAGGLTGDHFHGKVGRLGLDQVVTGHHQGGPIEHQVQGAASRDLETALKTVLRGDTYLSPSISKQVVEMFLRSDEPAADPLGGLTARQREILQLIAEGRSTKEIAADLGVSVKTVETHRAQLMERLDIHDIPGLVRFAIRAGLVSSDA
ncbi:MAG: response regulator transcription factor [Acidobacteria bacterium]|uniref:Response regulator transcription factor n=1 Tax=Candidatus Polarisedimenticola svalbardensis TaxID=2886004 RepID=A0A8J6XR77_9BACT|nr:response regulator transcription factor [Candidatus Polarisedimenticola svalbardensis]